MIKRIDPFHAFLVLISIAICVVLLMGTLRVFAAPLPVQTSSAVSASPELTLTPGAATPESTASPTAIPYTEPASADTTGIIALAIAMVLIVVVGVLWGNRSTARPSTTQASRAKKK
ncbi:MAG: hypothetical protein QMD04_10960 [Anaerolineales bacterium]|nr:hypothetical protein [Anaerolineales bacterium]